VGSYSGGSITLASALTDGYALTIVRQVPITQETDLRNQGSFFAETHEDVFDRLTMVAQQLQEQIDRSAKLPVTRTEDADALVADIVLLADNISDLDTLAANLLANSAEVDRGIALARRFPGIVVAVNVGNEALVEWNDHMVPLERVIEYVRRVRAAIDQPVTVADNYDWWARHGGPLATEVDFIGVHTYPQWEGKTIDEALPYSIENVAAVRAALPGKPIAILEAGWATVSSEFGERANEADQARHFGELRDWASANNTTVFWFEAFDEPWKGDPADPLGAEKHWGLFTVDRSPKRAMR
jgi:hypothetical protein